MFGEKQDTLQPKYAAQAVVGEHLLFKQYCNHHVSVCVFEFFHQFTVKVHVLTGAVLQQLTAMCRRAAVV